MGQARWVSPLTMVAVLLGTGCVALEPDAMTSLSAPGTVADRATFAAEASPLLEKRCGDALCHGRPERPFALYAAGVRRLEPKHTLLKAELTEAEVDANHRAVLGFLDALRPRDTTLLQKATGRMGHAGGPVFAAPSDPECVAIAAWILGQEAP